MHYVEIKAARANQSAKWGVHLKFDEKLLKIRIGKMNPDGLMSQLQPAAMVGDIVTDLNGFDPATRFPDPLMQVTIK